MKKIFLLSLVAAFFCHTCFAKIWRVNNNVGVSANFTSAQQAHDNPAVLAGDTLYFEHSSATYGPLDMTKGLKLIGAGYFLPQNPGLQYNSNVTYLENIILRPTATNSLISVSCGSILDSANNLTITRCKTGSIEFVATSNCTVANAHTGDIVFTARFTSNPCGSFGCTNMAIYNNICRGSIVQGALAYLPQNLGGCGNNWVSPHSVTVFNNSVSGTLRITGFAYNNISQSILTDGSTTVTNNIFYGVRTNSNRITFLPETNQSTASLESGNGNQFAVGASSIYTSIDVLVSNLADTAWHLKPASVALGAGTGGTDCGATGGGNPYVFGLQPPIPAIYKLNVAPAPAGNSIGVTISTRSNN